MLEKCISCIRISNFFLGGEDPDTPHGLHNFGARWVRLRPTWYRLPPKPKILATPLLFVEHGPELSACVDHRKAVMRSCERVESNVAGKLTFT